MDKRDAALSALEDEIGVLMGRVRRVVSDRAHMLHPELQAGSYLILGYIRTHGPVRATAIGEAFAIDKGSVSRHVQQLIDLRLVAREPDPQDGRAVLLTITEEGNAGLDEVGRSRRETLSARMQDWSAGQIDDFVAMLARYSAALSD